VTAKPLISSVTIERDATEGERSAIESLFAHYGLDVKVAATQPRNREMSFTEITIIETIAAFFASFGAAFGPGEGNDAYPLAKEWLQTLLQLRESTGGEGTVQIIDSDGTVLVLTTGIAGQALDALAHVEWATIKGGPLTWDQGAHRWHRVLEP
jgi:hypothetical protein